MKNTVYTERHETRPEITRVDWKVGPDDLLKAIDQQLAEFALQIELFDTGDDTYAWRIVRRKK